MRLKVSSLNRDRIKEVISLIQSYRYKPYHSYPDLSEEQITEYFLKEVSNLILESRKNFIFTTEKEGRIVGLAIIEKLPWDTEFFGIKMAKISHLIGYGSYQNAFDIKNELLTYISTLCLKEDIKFLSIKVNIGDYSSIHCLEEHGFRIMSTCATYLMEKEKYLAKYRDKITSNCTIRPYQDKDFSNLIAISKGSCVKSHFKADPSISQEKASDLYNEWIKNSCKGLVDEVIVIEADNKVIGCATFDIDKKFSTWFGYKLGRTPLIVFSKSVRGKGLSDLSILRLLLEYWFMKVDMVDVVIQIDNIKSAKYWLQLDSRMVDYRYVLHKWFSI